MALTTLQVFIGPAHGRKEKKKEFALRLCKKNNFKANFFSSKKLNQKVLESSLWLKKLSEHEQNMDRHI